MVRILSVFLDRKTKKPCGQYPNHESLFAGLERAETSAIQCLSMRTAAYMVKLGKTYQLTDDDIEELICDYVMICIQKIKDGQYVFQGYNPATFVIEIAKNRAHLFRRKALKHQTSSLVQTEDIFDLPPFSGQEDVAYLEKLLQQLEPNCQKLIRIKYLEERRDKAVIEAKLTQYTTVDALKNHRAKCMKKLIQLAQTAAPRYE